MIYETVSKYRILNNVSASINSNWVISKWFLQKTIFVDLWNLKICFKEFNGGIENLRSLFLIFVFICKFKRIIFHVVILMSGVFYEYFFLSAREDVFKWQIISGLVNEIWGVYVYFFKDSKSRKKLEGVERSWRELKGIVEGWREL